MNIKSIYDGGVLRTKLCTWHSVAEVEEFTSKRTVENFLKRVRGVLHCESLLPYSLALCTFWSGRFAGLNVKLSHF